jgi:hypothetical protein
MQILTKGELLLFTQRGTAFEVSRLTYRALGAVRRCLICGGSKCGTGVYLLPRPHQGRRLYCLRANVFTVINLLIR